MKFFWLFLALIVTSVQAHAGYLELINGDRAEGEFVRLEGDSVIWKSTNFGELNIKKNKVKNIVSAKPFKISGNDIPCMLEDMEGENLVYYCGLRSRMVRTPLLSMKVMTPYETFVEGEYVHHGRINLWGAYSRGNEVRDEWNVQAEFTLRRSEFRHTLGGEYARASWWYSEPPEKWNLSYGLDWFFRERWFWSNNVALGVEEARGIDNYYTLGSGAGYQFWENSKSALSLRSGLAYYNEVYMDSFVIDPDYEIDDNYTAWRLATDFRYTLPLGVSFFHNNELIQSFDDSSNFYLKTTTGLSAMILSKVYSELKVDYNVDNQPQPGKQEKDTRMSVGVSYKW
ncbi:DUF481 domain-containing protein [Cellvibrio sp. ARAG 10.3]|uniref:DUF481 domain-containing protein n=1 Tax=Cellvibrio sp. ARAG 10.3 TaxID=3451358 RepID=UPI003F489E37